MKNFKTGLLILFAIIIVILVFFLVKNLKIGNNQSNIKVVSEIEFMDNKLTSLLNSINNISLEKYQVFATSTNSNNDKDESSNSNNNSSSSSVSEQYALKSEGVLTENKDLNWDYIKDEIEILYTIIPTITLDLYNLNVNQLEILNFNKELDDLTLAVKEENMEQTLIKLANLYRYLPAYASKLSDNSDYSILLETKSNVFNSYVFANLDNWDESLNYIRKAIESYSTNFNKISNTDTNSYQMNKIYIILNEMKNAAEIKDKDIFILKYKIFLGTSPTQSNR